MIAHLLILLASTSALAEDIDITFCVKIHTDFTDPGGDFWATNGNRNARGVRYWIDDDDFLLKQGWAEEDGCEERTISVTSTYTVGVWSEAQFNGIDIKSYEVDCAEEDISVETGECDEDTTEELVGHAVVDIPKSNTTPLIIVPGDQTWYNLAVGMFALHRNDLNLGTYSARGCCHNESHSWFDEDGTCNSGTGSGDGREPYGEWDGATEILFFNKIWDGAGCCGSRFKPSWASSLIPGVHANNTWKFIIAHELGHTIVMERMGERTENNQFAPLDGCMGSYSSGSNANPFDRSDPSGWENDDGTGGKGLLTKEYQSTAAREGWASFYSAWLWNFKTENDCFYQTHGIQDFDLDGDIDNNYLHASDPDTGLYNQADTYDGAYTCEGAGIATVTEQPIPAGDTLESYIYAKDWLEDVINEGKCSGTTENRGTQYDWQRFFWDMLTDQEVPIEDLADIYVDMCPTTWSTDDLSGSEGEDLLPIERLRLSCIYHSHAYDWLQEKNNGQEH